ncbi:MAG: MMPL family transporter [Pseudomonadota bacterium]
MSGGKAWSRRRRQARKSSASASTRRKAHPASPLLERIGAGLEAWTEFTLARPRTVLVALLLLCCAAFATAAGRLAVDTDSSRMLAEDLPFQQRALALREAFPQLKESLVVVIRAETADAADAAASALRSTLAARSDRFESVFAPSVDPFFRSHGFLYGELEDVEARVNGLASAGNLLARLRTDQSLQNFLGAIAEARNLAAFSEVDKAALEAFQLEAAAVFAAHARGERRAFGWVGALDPAAPPPAADALASAPDGVVDPAEIVTPPTVRTMLLRPKLDYTRLNPAKPALEATRAAIDALPSEVTDGVQIGVTGDPALRADELQSVTETLAISLALSLLLVALALRAACGSMGRAMVALGILLVSLALTTGAAALLATPLNLVSVAFIVLMVGLGVDFAIHLLLYIEERVRRGFTFSYVLRRSAREVGPSLALSAATTALAFFAFTTTDFVGMAQLGLIGGVGVLIAFASAVTLTPAVAALRPNLLTSPRGAPPLNVLWRAIRPNDPSPRSGEARAANLAYWSERLGRVAPMAALLASFGAVALLPHARFDADPMNLRNADAPSMVAFAHLAEQSAGANGASPLTLSVLADDADAAAEVAGRLERSPLVASARSLRDFIPSDQEEKFELLDIAGISIEHAVAGEPTIFSETTAHSPTTLADEIERSDVGQNPETDPTAAQLAAALRLYAATPQAADAALQADLYRHFPAFMDRVAAMLEAQPVTEEALPEALRERFVAADGRLRVEASPAEDVRDPEALSAFVDAVAALEPRAAGGPVQIAGAARAVSGAMAQATLLALAATALLAFAALRRWSLTFAILAPLAAAGAMTAAAGVILGAPFNYANVIVLPLIIGVGVDSGVHLALRDVAVGPKKSVFSTSTPRAVVYSAATTIAAFGTLALSQHPGTASMGLLLAIGLAAALFSVLALTPVLIRWAQTGAASDAFFGPVRDALYGSRGEKGGRP